MRAPRRPNRRARRSGRSRRTPVAAATRSGRASAEIQPQPADRSQLPTAAQLPSSRPAQRQGRATAAKDRAEDRASVSNHRPCCRGRQPRPNRCAPPAEPPAEPPAPAADLKVSMADRIEPAARRPRRATRTPPALHGDPVAHPGRSRSRSARPRQTQNSLIVFIVPTTASTRNPCPLPTPRTAARSTTRSKARPTRRC